MYIKPNYSSDDSSLWGDLPDAPPQGEPMEGDMGPRGGLINPRPGPGQYRAGFSNAGGSPRKTRTENLMLGSDPNFECLMRVNEIMTESNFVSMFIFVALNQICDVFLHLISFPITDLYNMIDRILCSPFSCPAPVIVMPRHSHCCAPPQEG